MGWSGRLDRTAALAGIRDSMELTLERMRAAERGGTWLYAPHRMPHPVPTSVVARRVPEAWQLLDLLGGPPADPGGLQTHRLACRVSGTESGGLVATLRCWEQPVDGTVPGKTTGTCVLALLQEEAWVYDPSAGHGAAVRVADLSPCPDPDAGSVGEIDGYRFDL